MLRRPRFFQTIESHLVWWQAHGSGATQLSCYRIRDGYFCASKRRGFFPKVGKVQSETLGAAPIADGELVGGVGREKTGDEAKAVG